ncbi:hypothetical protein GCM10027289_20870 [Tsukamurella serpentis]
MTQPPNYPGDNQGQGPQDPYQGGYPQQPQQPDYPQGGFPPPAGGFPPPQGGEQGQGGFPPPPAGGYGQGGFPPPPGDYGQGGFPPPPGGGYGQPQFGGPAPFSIGDAFNWAWNKFTKNAVPLIVATLLYGLAMGALLGAFYFLLFSYLVNTAETDPDAMAQFSTTGSVGMIGASFVAAIVFAVIGSLINAAFFTGLLDIADGREVSIGSFFKPRNVGQVVIAALIVGLVTAIVTLIPLLGMILAFVLGFLTMFLIPVIVDRGVNAIDGFKQGFGIIQGDAGNSILTYLLMVVITLIGACLCGVGLLVAGPVAGLLLAYTYRRLSGGQVAPLTP